MNLDELTNSIIEMVRDIGNNVMYRKYKGYTVQEKGKSNYITDVDISTEKSIKSFLQKLLPCAAFYTEESSNNSFSKFTWIVDPIDGTTNFIHGLESYAISIALVEKNNDRMASLLGVVYLPETQICYYATATGRPYKIDFLKSKKEKSIDVSSIGNIGDSVLSFGFPYNKDKTDEILTYVGILIKRVQDIKRIGPASVDICRVAEGVIDGYLELDLEYWDIAAASLILERAGGKVHTISEQSKSLKSLLVTNGFLSKEIIELIEKT